MIPTGRSRRQLVRWTLLVLGPLLVAIVSAWFYLTGGRYEGTDDAYVQTASVAVSSNVAGSVFFGANCVW